jgi:putative ABC transport system substrate-binding protein
MIRRREFITLLGGSGAWPLAARAQQPAMPVVGILLATTAEAMPSLLTALRLVLNEAGYVEGRNIAFEIRAAEGRLDRLPALAMDLVRRRVAVIYSPGGLPAALAAKAATYTIPIVFGIGIDPVNVGLVDSFNRPGGNMTGITVVSDVLRSKQVELLHGAAPSAADFAFLADPAARRTRGDVADMEAAARALGWQMKVFNARNEQDRPPIAEFAAVFAAMAEQHVGALLIQDSGVFNSHPEGLAAFAMSIRVPTLSTWREFPAAGGLMSYGATHSDSGRQLAQYIVRILKGEKPADLPVVRPTKFEFVLNLKTAKALGLTVPPTLLALATEVME